MSQMYVTSFENVSVSAAFPNYDLFEIAPAAETPCIIHAVFISQSTEIGDAEEEMLRIKIIRGHTTSGTSGGTANEIPMNANDAAAGYTGEIHNSGLATAGTPVELYAGAFNVRTGWQMIWTPDMRPVVTGAQGTLVVRMLGAVDDTMSISGTIYVEESK